MTSDAKRALTNEERRELLQDVASLASDADVHPDILRVFLPLPHHALALRDQIMVVRGERGAGKTALFHFLAGLAEAGLPPHKVFELPNASPNRWVEGFSESSTKHPSPLVLDAFAARVPDAMLRIFWMGHLVRRVAESNLTQAPSGNAFLKVSTEARNDPARWVDAAQRELAALAGWMDELEAELRQSGRRVTVVYDHLDKIGTLEAATRERFASTLLALWLSLSNRYRHIRAKIFIREDLFAASQRASADASKLLSRSVSLQWDTEALFRMLVRHLANISPSLRDWLQTGSMGLRLHNNPILGWMPPATLPPEGRESQKIFIDHLAGKQMGRGLKKGYVYRWIPNRLQDAHGAIVPRSVLNLIAYAAEWALRNGPTAKYTRLLTPLELRAAVEKTSQQRGAELREEHPVIGRIESLRGLTVMADRLDVVKRLCAGGPNVHDAYGDDGERVFDELLQLGVLKTRSDGRVDVPDIYRYGYGIKRKGHVARPR